jgi:hypothetical protein
MTHHFKETFMFNTRRILFAGLIIAPSLSGVALAAPITLTFEALAGTSSISDIAPLPDPFSEGGFNFAFDSHPIDGIETGLFVIDTTAPCVSPCSSNGTAAFFNFNYGALTLSRSDGLAFSLLALDAAQGFVGFGSSLELHVNALFAGGGSISTVFNSAPGGADVFSTFSLPSTFTNLVSVTFIGNPETSVASTFALDNLVLNPLPREVEATPVPEPSALALFGFGLLGVGFARRSRATA